MRTMLNALGARRAALQNEDRQKGFTLIELLVVVIIIGILAAIAIPVYLGVQSNAKDSAIKADLTNLKTAVVAYQTDNNGTMPANVAALTSVSIDGANYTTTPELKVTGTGAATTFTICGVGSNSNAFVVTGTTAPTGVATCP